MTKYATCDVCEGFDLHYGPCPQSRDTPDVPTYDPSEQDIIIDEFVKLLKLVTKDGGRKRARGEKTPWWKDQSHEAAIYSHLSKWKKGELVDAGSGTHPLVHAAWRCLAIAYQQTRGLVEPK